MAEPYLGEIRIFCGNYAPAGWNFCDGTMLPIAENESLYGLIGTTYGGDGVQNFALPDLRGRAPIHQGSGSTIGQNGGVESVTLTVAQYPSHTHGLSGSSATATALTPANNVPATATKHFYTNNVGNAQAMAAGTVTASAGGGLPHGNMQPFLVVNYIIALAGIYPSQS